MATITLSADTLISTLMPSGGGSLASGDTIQLAGHSLIIDADAVDYPVTIANSGGDANLELRDLGRIKLNATLPTNVHPYINPAHPLPVSAEPGIDGDPYRTNLTANARAEIQLNGTFGLGGGAASLPTATRTGNFWAKIASSSDSTHLTFDRDMPLHAGDCILSVNAWDNIARAVVQSYDATTRTATILSEAGSRAVGSAWGLVSGGVVIYGTGALSATMSAGTINFFGNSTSRSPKGTSGIISARRIGLCISNNYDASLFSGNSVGKVGEFVGGRLFASNTTIFSSLLVGEICAFQLARDSVSASPAVDGLCTINSGIIVDSAFTSIVKGSCIIHLGTTEVKSPYVLYGSYTALCWDNQIISNAGTITLHTSGSWLHSPATSSDVTWRYTDRTVAPGSTLRLRCVWIREGSAAPRASVAVTDPATWWPQLWPLGAEALASVEFTGGTADLRQELLAWRNTGTEAVQVRVWECVTGTVSGGYLKVEEVKGGQL